MTAGQLSEPDSLDKLTELEAIEQLINHRPFLASSVPIDVYLKPSNHNQPRHNQPAQTTTRQPTHKDKMVNTQAVKPAQAFDFIVVGGKETKQ